MTLPKLQRSPKILLALLLLAGLACVIFISRGEEQNRESALELTGEASGKAALELDGDLSGPNAAARSNTRDLRAPLLASGRLAVGQGARAQLELGASEGSLLEGTVIESEGGARIAGAHVQAGDADWWVEGESDSAGQFQLRLPATRGAALSVSATGHAPLQRPLPAAGENLVVALQPEARLHGQIEGPALDVCEGALVSLWDLRGDHARLEPAAQTQIDDEGSFDFMGLAAGEVQIAVQIEGFAFEFAHALALTQGETHSLVLRPSPGASVHGQVLLLDTVDPVVGARVRVLPLTQGIGRHLREVLELETASDAQGRYELKGLPAGESRLVVETQWGAQKQVKIWGDGTARELIEDFALPATGGLSGHVLNNSQQAVAGAQLLLTWQGQEVFREPDAAPDSSPGPGSLRAQADATGRFEFPFLPAGRALHLIAFRAARSSSGPLQADLLSPTKNLRLSSGEFIADYSIVLQALESVSGRVIDELGRPIPGASLKIHFSSGKSQDKNKVGLFHSQSESDGEGQFELIGLLPGQYTIEAECVGFLRHRRRFRVFASPASQVPLELELSPAHGLDGFIIDERGNSIPFAQALAQPLGTAPVKNLKTTQADARGHFVFERLQPGGYILGGKATGYKKSPLPWFEVQENESGPIQIVLELDPDKERCSIIGRLASLDGGELLGVRAKGLSTGVLRLQGERFEVQGAKPGHSKLRFEATGYLPPKMPVMQLSPGTQTDIGVVQFSPAAQLQVFVRNAKHRPLSGAQIQLISTRPAAPRKPGGRARREIVGMSRGKRKHSWGGRGKPRQLMAAFSDRVPYGSWKLLVVQAGHQPWSRLLHFDETSREQVIDVQLKAKQKGKQKGKQKK